MAGFSYRGRETQTETEMFSYRSQTPQKDKEAEEVALKRGKKDMRTHFSQKKIQFNSILLFNLVIDMEN